MLLMIDNYDFFIYNLVQYFGEFKVEVKVVCNDELSVEQIEVLVFECIVFFFGFCIFNEVGVLLVVIECFVGKLLLFGVCFGYQSIGQVFGGEVVWVWQVMYGKISLIYYKDFGVFVGLVNFLMVMCYYLLVVK